nr:hypothetical protein [Tanacetum cinerariifolium]
KFINTSSDIEPTGSIPCQRVSSRGRLLKPTPMLLQLSNGIDAPAGEGTYGSKRKQPKKLSLNNINVWARLMDQMMQLYNQQGNERMVPIALEVGRLLPTTFESSAGDSSSESSAGPSRKRCRSPAATVISSIHATRALIPSRADLLPPHKRFRDSISLEDNVKEDIDTNVLKDIEADATAVEVAVDRKVKAGIDVGIGMEVDVRVDVEDEVENEAASSDRSTMEVGVDVVVGIDIPDGMLMPDAAECLEQVEKGYRELEARSLIAGRERASLLDHVASLVKSNARLRGTMMMERNMTITHSGMTPEAIKELVNRRVEEALAAYEVTHVTNALEAESQSQNGSDDDNGNGGDGNGGNRNGGNRNPNENNRDARHVVRECTYKDFRKCQPLNFKGTEGVFGLTRWFEKMETVFHISNCLEKYQVKAHEANGYRPRNEIQKIESELWNLAVKNNDLVAYTQRFLELTMMCTKMVPEEEDRVEKFIGGLPDNIQRNVIATEPTRLQDADRIANNLMDQKLKGYGVKNAENKKRLEVNQRDNRRHQPPFKRQNVRGQDVVRAYTTGNNETKPYNGPLPLCNKCKLHHEGPCIVRCGKCNKIRHLTWECGGDAKPDSNVITGTFILNNHYAFVLFDSDVDRSFVSTTFSSLLDVTPDTLDVSYAVELADEIISKTNTILRGCTLGLLGHPFNIDLMPVELEDFPGLPPTRKVEFQINLVPGAAPMSEDEHAEYLKLILELLKKEEMYAKFQRKLYSAPILALPEGSENFVVYCDASCKGLGPILMDRPIFLNDNEEHSVQNKESLDNSSKEIDVSNSNQEKEELSQDSDIHQLIEECCTKVFEEVSHETFQCQPMAQNIDFSGSDQIQTPQYPDVHPPSQEKSDEFFQANHSVQYKENLENSLNSNQEKEEPPQDSDIRQLIREECCVEASEEQKQSIEDTMLELKPKETFNEAWERFKDLLRQCPHQGFFELHQLDTFYNALNPNDQDVLDSAAGGNFLDKIPRERFLIIESKSKVRLSSSRVTDSRANTNASLSSSLPSNSFDLQQIAASLEDKLDIRMNRFEKSLQDMKDSFITPTAPFKAVEEVCVTCGANHSYNQCPLTRENEFPVFHDNIQQFKTTAAIVRAVERLRLQDSLSSGKANVVADVLSQKERIKPYEFKLWL